MMTNLLSSAVMAKTRQLLSTLASTRLLLVMFLTLTVSAEVWAETITDEITASDLKATSTTYTAFSNVSKSSSAIYAGQSAKDSSGNIQLRSKNSNSGIVSTTSGGKVKSVKITVGSGSNTVDVYGSNTAYTAAEDLYDTNKQGTKIGSVTSTKTITFAKDYTYVGIRSSSGAIYLSQIDIVWETASATPSHTITATSNNNSYGTVSVSGTTITATPKDGYRVKSGDAGYTVTSGTADVTNNGDNTFSVTPSSNCTITINFEAIPTYTINWHTAVGTVEDEVLEEGATITKPATDPTMTGYKFMGWTEDCEVASDGAGFTAITNFGTATKDKDYYAVFAKANISDGGGDYIRVTQNLADWSGDYLIAYSNTIFANGKIGGTDGIGKQYNTVDLSQYVDNNIIPVEYGDPIHVTLEKSSTEKYLLKTQDGKYNYYSSNNNGISSTTSQNTANPYAITITYTSKDDIKLCLSGNAQGAVFRYNAQGYFRFYKNGGQNPVYLYKKSAGTTTYSNYITTCTTEPTHYLLRK